MIRRERLHGRSAALLAVFYALSHETVEAARLGDRDNDGQLPCALDLPLPTVAPVTAAPTPAPTPCPTPCPTPAPTPCPTTAPTPSPTPCPTKDPVQEDIEKLENEVKVAEWECSEGKRCAAEGEDCTCDGMVKFGHKHAWTPWKTSSGVVKCVKSNFEPAPPKVCVCKPFAPAAARTAAAAAPSPYGELCAKEGEHCSCAGAVRFGNGTLWSNPKQVAHLIECKAENFAPLDLEVNECKCRAKKPALTTTTTTTTLAPTPAPTPVPTLDPKQAEAKKAALAKENAAMKAQVEQKEKPPSPVSPTVPPLPQPAPPPDCAPCQKAAPPDAVDYDSMIKALQPSTTPKPAAGANPAAQAAAAAAQGALKAIEEAAKPCPSSSSSILQDVTPAK